MEVDMLKSATGPLGVHRKGGRYTLPDELAKAYEAAGLRTIVTSTKKPTNADKDKRTTSRGAGKSRRGKGLAKG